MTHPTVVRLYTRLYAARLGLVSHPQPRGALSPIEWRRTRFNEVRAAMRFLSEGRLIPNFIPESAGATYSLTVAPAAVR